jgi:hypothetical protein
MQARVGTEIPSPRPAVEGGKDGMGPVDPFEPVGRRSDTQQVRRELRVQMVGELYPRGHRNPHGAHPARDAADPHEIAHRVVHATGFQEVQEIPCTIVIFARLQRRPSLAVKLGVATEVVVCDRLLEPVETLLVEFVATAHRDARCPAAS